MKINSVLNFLDSAATFAYKASRFVPIVSGFSVFGGKLIHFCGGKFLKLFKKKEKSPPKVFFASRVVKEVGSATKGDCIASLIPGVNIFYFIDKGKKRRTPLHSASLNGNKEEVEALLKGLDKFQKLGQLKKKDQNSRTPLHDAGLNKNKEVIKALLKGLDKSEKLELLKLQDKKGETATALHGAAYMGNKEVIEAIFEDLDKSEKLELLKLQDKEGRTPLHRVAFNHSKEAIEAIFEDLDKSEKLELLKLQDKEGLSPLHQAALKSFNKQSQMLIIQNFLKDLEPSQIEELKSIKDNDQKTYLEYLKSS